MPPTSDTTRVILFGATGLVGQHVLAQLPHHAACGPVHLVGRTPPATPLPAHTTYHHSDLASAAALTALLKPLKADVGICALGTTIAKAGSKHGLYHVDHELVLNAARACHAAGVSTFAVVSSIGANPRARSHYLRVKGETERDLKPLAFKRLIIIRPSLLLGNRQEPRRLEGALTRLAPYLSPFFLGPLRRYRFVTAHAVAHTLIHHVRCAPHGVSIIENEAIDEIS